jgi:ADP-ribose pyrophosphatase
MIPHVGSDLNPPTILRRVSVLVAPDLRTPHPALMDSIRRRILKMGVVDIGVERAALPDGRTLELPVIRHPGASAIVALDNDGRVAMLTQYRHAVGGWHREIPAGCRDGAETPLECAKRELREETGLTARLWDHLAAIVTIPSFCDERIELFLARELTQEAINPEPDEIIRVERLGFKEALDLIRQGTIVDAKTVAALHHAQAFLA